MNTMYHVALAILTRQHINAIMDTTHWQEYIHNVYELPSIKQMIWYYHASAGFLTKHHITNPNMETLQHSVIVYVYHIDQGIRNTRGYETLTKLVR